MLLLVGVFYKWKLSEVDNISSLLVLSITGKEISKPRNITVNLFSSSISLLVTASCILKLWIYMPF